MATRRKAARVPRLVAAAPTQQASYVPSPEHKTHPGPWGIAQWHPRVPEIEACPTDLDSTMPSTWLLSALAQPACWDPAADTVNGALPAYLYWYVPGRGFFEAQRNQRHGTAGPFTYKGYPAKAHKVSLVVATAMHAAGLIADDQLLEWKRLARRGIRGAR